MFLLIPPVSIPAHPNLMLSLRLSFKFGYSSNYVLIIKSLNYNEKHLLLKHTDSPKTITT